MTTRRLFKDEDALFRVDIKKIKPGTLLLAEPFMPDPNFKRTVVLICEHNEDGTLGFILNRETELKLNDAVDGIENFESTLYFGGPVQTDSLHFLHPFEELEGSVKVAEGIYWGG
ncbi:MAG TPA: YqgE/AlgH family protein, partial [Flavobacterium sp.]|nr:YqgE/AlgH family protein [Flavobacterium sp.]